MRILVVGGGGREHALCWALHRSPLVSRIFCAPGNGGIRDIAACSPVATGDIEGLLALAHDEKVDLVVVGPEAPLVAGLIDRMKSAGIRAIGPTASAARLEGSKQFTKSFCARRGIPTANSECFGRENLEAALAYIQGHSMPCVIKADGLAGGKGVVIAQSIAEASKTIRSMLSGNFGAAGETILVEEFLQGFEVSLFALSDGRHVVEFGTAQDHKRAFDGDLGPNTGGMGAFSPAWQFTDAMKSQAMAEIVEPTIRGMAEEGIPYSGFLFAGLMITADGPKLIEFNCRMGDPECQVVLMRLETDLAQLLLQCSEHRLDGTGLAWRDDTAITVVMASRGYPGPYSTGSAIKGLDTLAKTREEICFHAGTACRGDEIVSSGGRVLNVAATGPNLMIAQRRVYEAIKMIDWPDGYYRSDIGARALQSIS